MSNDLPPIIHLLEDTCIKALQKYIGVTITEELHDIISVQLIEITYNFLIDHGITLDLTDEEILNIDLGIINNNLADKIKAGIPKLVAKYH